MANRRAAHCKRRRGQHRQMREAAVMNQGVRSSSEGPDDGIKPAKAQRAWRSRRA